MSRTFLPLIVNLDGLTVALAGEGPAVTAAESRLSALGATVRRLGSTPGAHDLAGAPLVVLAGQSAAVDAARQAAADAGVLTVATGGGVEARAQAGVLSTGEGLSFAAFASSPAPEFEAHAADLAARAASPALARFGSICAGLAVKLEERFPDALRRAGIWRQILESPVLPMLEAGLEDEAAELAERMAWGTG